MAGNMWYSPPRIMRDQSKMVEEGALGYKQIGKNLSFADLAVSKSLEHNHSLKMMEKIRGLLC